MKQRLYIVISVLTAIFMLMGCGDKTQKMVIVYSPHGGDILSQFEELFEKKYPDIDVQWIEMGSQDVLDRIRSEKENPQGDIWWGAPSTMFMNASKEGLLQPYKPTWADAVENIYKDTNDMWYGTFLTPEVIAFNNQLVKKEDAPKDWDELLEPRWKDQIIIRYPLASGTMRAIYSAMIWRFYKDTGDPSKGYEWLLKLDANTKEYAASPTMMQQKLARGEGTITVWNMPDIVFQAEAKGFPFGYVIPESGTPVVTEGMAVIKGSKHPEQAKLYYEFVNNVESMIILAKEHYRIPARTDIPKESLPEWIADTEFEPMDIDWEVFSNKSAEWMKYWEQNIKNRGQ
ncbi:extracellular solute-binding protein [Candidatus Poribacteria bacterium]|nr:extracellular solute-binding protein [Candidatus Poribacteria bacterium]